MTSTIHSRKRMAQVKAGAYDGRYKTKVVPNKKKEVSKKACRTIKHPGVGQENIP